MKLRTRHRSVAPLTASVLAGLAVGGVVVFTGHGSLAFISGWITLCVVHCLWIWLVVRGMDGHQTESHARMGDSSRKVTDPLLLVAVAASLGGVGLLLAGSSSKGGNGYLEGVLGLAAVAGSWFLVHLLFTLRYAREYYGEGNRGVDFTEDDQPDYQDFAYLSFCLGMTYQVSDQTTRTRAMRRLVMRHTLLSYGLGAVVLACSINLVVQLAS